VCGCSAKGCALRFLCPGRAAAFFMPPGPLRTPYLVKPAALQCTASVGATLAALLLAPIQAPTRIEDVGGCEVVSQHLAFEFLRDRHALFVDEFRHIETEFVTRLRGHGFLQGFRI